MSLTKMVLVVVLCSGCAAFQKKQSIGCDSPDWINTCACDVDKCDFAYPKGKDIK